MTEGQTIDREQFLKDNKLGDVLDIFTKRDITIEELLEFDKSDLKLFGKEIGLDALSQNRLVKAITRLKPTEDIHAAPPFASGTLSTGFTSSLATSFVSSGGATHVIVSPEEHEAISKLYERYEDSSKLIVSLKDSFDLLKKSAAKCKIDVNGGFDQLVVSLENKKKELIEECKTVKDVKKEKLMDQLQQLKEYCSTITNGKKKYEEYISDANMDIHKRKNAILTMIDDILKNRKVPLVMITQPKMAFNVDNKQVTKFLESLVIDDCDQPFPPVITITKIEHDRVVVQWHLDAKYQTNNTKKVLAFEVSWCKLPKTYLKIDEKEHKLQKTKKERKQKKKKKRKKKKRYDSSDYDDSSDDDASDKEEIESDEEEEDSKPNEGDKPVTGSTLKPIFQKKSAPKKDEKIQKKKSKKKRKSKDTDSDNSDTESDSDSDSDSNSSSDSDSDSSSSSSSSSSDSDSSSNSDTDSEEEEKRGSRRKRKGKKKEKKVEFEVMEEWKEMDEMKWETEEIHIKKDREISVSKRFKFAIEELRDNTAYCIRIRGRNTSGWGQFTKCIKIQTPKMSIASRILKTKEMGYLMKVLPKKLRSKRYKLLFRASKDGFAAATFHAKCNNKGATITIAQSTSNHIFGGYTSFPWTSSGSYKQDQNAFIFLLRSSRGKKSSVPKKWNVMNVTNSVQHNASYGPTFGGGHDFYLCNNCNSVNSSYSNLGHSYSAPKDQSMLAGSYNFMVKDYEVWQVK